MQSLQTGGPQSRDSDKLILVTNMIQTQTTKQNSFVKKFLFNFETPSQFKSLYLFIHFKVLKIKFSILFLSNKIKVFEVFPDTLHGTQQLSLFQQVQCSPVAAGLRRELQFCHQWGEEKFSPIPALVPLPQWGQWSRHQRRRWVNIYKAAILARKMKKVVPDDKNN